MKYHDTSTLDPATGERNPDQALIKWLESVLTEDVDELRLQTGYFRLEAVRALASALLRPALRATFLIGSNDGDTTFDEAHKLMVRLGIPRDNARLGIVSFASGLFHPKTYYVRRNDGSQAAFVGSCNFTPAGITLGNIEAAISVDTREGDSADVLNAIAAAIDRWFEAPLPVGMNLITDISVLHRLKEEGVLSVARPPRLPKAGSEKSDASASNGKPSLRKTIKLPAWPAEPESPEELVQEAEEPSEAPSEEAMADSPSDESSGILTGVDSDEPGGESPSTSALPTVGAESAIEPVVPVPLPHGLPVANLTDFPNYLLFAPGASEPTSGAAALTGASLPAGCAGLIVILNRDNSRHFAGQSGTANISIPVSVAGTIRFGRYGVHMRPFAYVNVQVRYVNDSLVLEASVRKTSISGYGYTAGESGHADIRFVLPAQSAREIAKEVKSRGLPAPTEGDLVFLEWPAPGESTFGFTILERGSALANSALTLYESADKQGLLVGGSCWLPYGLAPAW